MLQFPPWKIALILLTLLTGGLLALPNLFTDAELGLPPRPPSSDAPAATAAYERAVAAAEASNWPGFLPNGKVNLGLDLQGGVYLLMEINPDEVAANRLSIIRRDVGDALRGRPRVPQISEIVGDRLRIELQGDDPDVEEALRRIRPLNTTVAGTIGGARLFEITQPRPGVMELQLTPAAREAEVADARDKAMEIVSRRIDPNGVAEITVQPQGETRIILEAPGEADPQRLKDILSRAGRMTFNLVDSTPSSLQNALSGRPPPGFELIYDIETGEPLVVNEDPVVTGSDIATASQGFDSRDNSPAVDFRLNGAGARRFGDATAANVRERFAIVLDGNVMSAPQIREPIYQGQVQITGSFSIEEARDLAAIIEAGELPAKLDFIEERTVGPGLGADSIRAGATASIIGLVLVAVFMIIAYGLFGGFAVGSLVANIILILGALSGFGATLTLPGIAGIILTVGMAVDANVLVFERIREEYRAGRSPLTAVQAGYERALSTILDANITTFLAAAILYLLGSGPVKGFAVTLAIGILTSVFTAFVVTRWFTSMWLRRFRPKKLAF